MELKQLFGGGGNALPELLIVPYGIETTGGEPLMQDVKAFNRTLWN